MVAAAGDDDQLVLAQFDGLAGVLDERGDVGGDEVLPSPTPTTSGDDRRAATIVSGSSACVTTSVNAPSSRRHTAPTLAGRSPLVSPSV